MEKTFIEIKERLAVIETKVDEVINNHINHLTKRIDQIYWLLLSLLIGILINILGRLWT